ncbi:hypothetical protein I4U23_005001 [Adineta vaga]|nr:hypothetical protein I4U23_005001 [Adineta vaga]
MDTFGYIYNSTWNPVDPYENLLSMDDDTGGNGQFLLANVLQAMTTYMVVLSAYDERVTGRFSLIGYGPDSISLVRVNITTNSSKVKSIYSSTLTTRSPQFCHRPTCPTATYFYQPIQVIVSTTGTYTVLCSSNMDSTGYIYNNTFYSSFPILNQFASDDDSGGGRQFMFRVFLQTVGKYILIVTTYKQNATGSFSIRIIGDGPVNFVSP